METFLKRSSTLGVVLVAAITFSSAANADWNYGFGPGGGWTNIEGNQGFNTLVGPVKYDVSFSPDDLSDMASSGYGLGGYATDGKWLVQYSLSSIELEDTDTAVVAAHTVNTKINFTTSGGEVTVGYPIRMSSAVATYLDAGLRYTKHELDNLVTISGPTVNTEGKSVFSNNWTDAIVGLTINVPLSQQWSWNNRLNAGFGASDGTYLATTGVTWRFHKNWSAALRAKYVNVKYENGSQGQSDWYLYDAEETTGSLAVLYNW